MSRYFRPPNWRKGLGEFGDPPTPEYIAEQAYRKALCDWLDRNGIDHRTVVAHPVFLRGRYICFEQFVIRNGHRVWRYGVDEDGDYGVIGYVKRRRKVIQTSRFEDAS